MLPSEAWRRSTTETTAMLQCQPHPWLHRAHARAHGHGHARGRLPRGLLSTMWGSNI